MSFCNNCGASVNEGASFCSKCGQPLNAVPQSQPESPQQPYQQAPVYNKPTSDLGSQSTLDQQQGRYYYNTTPTPVAVNNRKDVLSLVMGIIAFFFSGMSAVSLINFIKYFKYAQYLYVATANVTASLILAVVFYISAIPFSIVALASQGKYRNQTQKPHNAKTIIGMILAILALVGGVIFISISSTIYVNLRY